MKEYWKKSREELEAEFHVTEKGLNQKQVEEIRSRKGENKLQEGKQKSVVQVFFSQFCDLLVLILIVAAVVSLFSGNMESSIVIFFVLILNAVLGTVQHLKAQQSLESLKNLSAPSAKVVRDGRKIEVPSKEIVPGDIVILEAGDMIVADGRILKNFSLQVNESSLTGESTNVEKSDSILNGEVALADRVNMVHSGSLVTYGRAEVLVTATGMETEIGKIAELMNDAKERKTPLQVSLDQFSVRLAILIMVVCAFVFGMCLYRKMPILDSMMFAVALAVAAIPEALSSIVTIVQAIGTQKMAQENAIIKELKAVESLGCVSVICSDKTGTLTQNKMTVQKVYLNHEVLTPEEIDITDKTHRYFLYDAILNNDSSIVEGKGIGDPTEYALLEMFRKVRFHHNLLEEETGFEEDNIRTVMKRMSELPFDSDRKQMTTQYALHGVPTLLTKGAPDILIEKCTHIADKNTRRKITQEEKEAIKMQNQSFSEQGLRVLAFAYKESPEELSMEEECDFTFIGLSAMIDPPREESIEAVANAKKAGIKTVMITGDHKVTATAIAKEIGIFQEGDMAVTGFELDNMSEEELMKKIEKISVYARVSPENKIRIVNAWQEKGKIVAMTGDGVNDAPALKKADIGVAMGITGTEVSKDAAAMILSDDNFATIIQAVTNGRNVYRNIKNAIIFLLSGNMAGILTVLYTSIRNLPMPFLPVHLLFINLLTDSLPAIAIGMEASDASLLEEGVRNPKEGILTKDFLKKIGLQGLLIAIVTTTAFYIGLGKSEGLASTMAFVTLTLARLFHGFNCRGEKSIFELKLTSNKYSLLAFATGIIFLVSVVFIPFFSRVFGVVPLNATCILQTIGLAFLPTAIIQLKKELF